MEIFIQYYLKKIKVMKNGFKKILNDLYERVYKLGGLISAEHGGGYIKRDQFIKHPNKNNIDLMRKIKEAFDPKNLLNPNKII